MTSTTFFFVFIPLLAFILLAVNLIFAPHNPYSEKDSAFECGFHSFLGQNRTQFSISFFIFALLFLLFDLEILLVYPYIVSAYTNDIYGLVIMLIFFLVLTLGFAFELGKNALKIDSRQMYSNTSNASQIISHINHISSNFITDKQITRSDVDLSVVAIDIVINIDFSVVTDIVISLVIIDIVYNLDYSSVTDIVNNLDISSIELWQDMKKGFSDFINNGNLEQSLPKEEPLHPESLPKEVEPSPKEVEPSPKEVEPSPIDPSLSHPESLPKQLEPTSDICSSKDSSKDSVPQVSLSDFNKWLENPSFGLSVSDWYAQRIPQYLWDSVNITVFMANNITPAITQVPITYLSEIPLRLPAEIIQLIGEYRFIFEYHDRVVDFRRESHLLDIDLHRYFTTDDNQSSLPTHYRRELRRTLVERILFLDQERTYFDSLLAWAERSNTRLVESLSEHLGVPRIRVVDMSISWASPYVDEERFQDCRHVWDVMHAHIGTVFIIR